MSYSGIMNFCCLPYLEPFSKLVRRSFFACTRFEGCDFTQTCPACFINRERLNCLCDIGKWHFYKIRKLTSLTKDFIHQNFGTSSFRLFLIRQQDSHLLFIKRKQTKKQTPFEQFKELNPSENLEYRPDYLRDIILKRKSNVPKF